MRYEGFNHDWLYAYLDELGRMLKRGREVDGKTQKYVIVRTVIYNDPDKVVAKRLNKSRQTISNIRKRAYANLRRLMERAKPVSDYFSSVDPE